MYGLKRIPKKEKVLEVRGIVSFIQFFPTHLSIYPKLVLDQKFFF